MRPLPNIPLLDEIIETSNRCFGFFTSRFPRVYEYTWIVKKINSPSLVLDIGTGTSPVPVVLAERGNSVVTVDYWTEETTNEWGFVDYSVIHPAIESYNQDFTEFISSDQFDVIYSISALEHMPKNTRKAVIFNAYAHLIPDGWFYATIDVKKDTEDIWDKSYGKVIEDDHGTISDVIGELKDTGFRDIEFYTQKHIKGVATDLLYIEAQK